VTRTAPTPAPVSVLTAHGPAAPAAGVLLALANVSVSTYGNDNSNSAPVTAGMSLVVHPTACTQCGMARPERAAHCGRAGLCVARFDHYCPWIANAVGAGNHRTSYAR